MPKYPFMARRKGSRNYYYKRPVPRALQADGRPKQIWRSLNTDSEAAAKVAYRMVDAETDALFTRWRQDDSQPFGSVQSPLPAKAAPNFVPLTPAVLRRLVDAHYLDVYEADFQWRGDLWKKVHEDEAAFWDGQIIKLPDDDWNEIKGQQSSYFAYLMEDPILDEVFLYAVFRTRKAKLKRLQRQYQLGDSGDHAQIADGLLRSKDVCLGDADRLRLMRKLMESEIKALEDITAGNEASFDGIVEREVAVEPPIQSVPTTKPGELMSLLVEKYIDDTSREREWPIKTVGRKRGELREFLEIAGDKPVNAYRQVDGVNFKDVQMGLPIHRKRVSFKGLTLADAAKRASELRVAGEKIDLLNPITINDKDVRALRDHALLLLGFFGALRRSELVALDVSGGHAAGGSFVDISPAGLLLHLTRSKASAATQTIAIPRRADDLCAARALECYLAATGLTQGPLLRPVSKAGRLLTRRLDATAVRHILQQRVGGGRFSPHSLRAGFITSTARAGAPEHAIQRLSRHRSLDVLRSYMRSADPFAAPAAGWI